MYELYFHPDNIEINVWKLHIYSYTAIGLLHLKALKDHRI